MGGMRGEEAAACDDGAALRLVLKNPLTTTPIHLLLPLSSKKTRSVVNNYQPSQAICQYCWTRPKTAISNIEMATNRYYAKNVIYCKELFTYYVSQYLPPPQVTIY